MHATRFWVPAWLAALGSLAVFSCGSDEATSPSNPNGGGEAGEAGAPAFPGAGNGGNGGSTAGGSFSSGALGGAGLGPTGAAGVGDAPAAGGEGGALGGAGAGGRPATLDGEQLELCARLSGAVENARHVETAYAISANADCRVKWVIPLEQIPLVNFRNELFIWSLDFWGCQGNPVDTFALVYETPALSRGDVTVLIDHYMTAAQDELELSPPEFEEMQAALERLAAPLITDTTTEPSNSQCVAAGGAGGASGGIP